MPLSLRGATNGSDVAISSFVLSRNSGLPRRLRSASPPRNDNTQIVTKIKQTTKHPAPTGCFIIKLYDYK